MAAVSKQLAADLLLYRFHAQQVLPHATADGSAVETGLCEQSIEAAFHRFNLENPHVRILFCGFAFELLLRGRSGSAKLIFERMRWEYLINTTDVEFKLNNNYTSRMARLAMETYPSLQGFFELRVLHGPG